jgi:hypothetical protein
MILEPSISKFFLSSFMIIIVMSITPKNENRPSNNLLHIMLLTTIIPILSFYWLANQSTEYTFYVFISYILISSILRSNKMIGIKLLKREINLSIRIINVMFMLSLIILLIILYKFGGIDLRALDFDQVYELRSEAKYSGLWVYILNWLGKALIPLCIIVYMYKRKYFLLFISIIMQLTLYMSTGHKTTLLSVAIIIAFYYFLKRKHFISVLPKLYTGLLFMSMIVYELINYNWGLALFPLRMLSIPAWLNFIHYDFFSTNEHIYFSEGLIGKILGLQYPYSIPSTFLVSPNTANANTGFLADAYDNGGLLVMLLFSVVFSFLLLYVDYISSKSNNRFIYSVFFVYPIIILNDSALLTALLTSGLFIVFAFSYIYISEENYFICKGLSRGINLNDRKKLCEEET